MNEKLTRQFRKMPRKMQRRFMLWAEVKLAYRIMKQTLARAKRLQAKHEIPGLAPKIAQLQEQVDKMESIMEANDGMGAIFIPILIAIAAAAVLGLVGVVGIKDLVKRMVPEVSEETMTKWFKITAVASVLGVGLYAALSKRPVQISAVAAQRYRPSRSAATKEGK